MRCISQRQRGGEDTRLGEYWDKVTGFVGAFKVPSLKEDDLPEATAAVCSDRARRRQVFRGTLDHCPASDEPRL